MRGLLGSGLSVGNIDGARQPISPRPRLSLLPERLQPRSVSVAACPFGGCASASRAPSLSGFDSSRGPVCLSGSGVTPSATHLAQRELRRECSPARPADDSIGRDCPAGVAGKLCFSSPPRLRPADARPSAIRARARLDFAEATPSLRHRATASWRRLEALASRQRRKCGLESRHEAFQSIHRGAGCADPFARVGRGERAAAVAVAWMDGCVGHLPVSGRCVFRRMACGGPDWRGFGKSGHAGDAYWFPDYLADLDRIVDTRCRRGAGATAWAQHGRERGLHVCGRAPARVSSVVSLDGFGLADRGPPKRRADSKSGSRSLAHRSGFGAIRTSKSSPRACKETILASIEGRRFSGGASWRGRDGWHRRPRCGSCAPAGQPGALSTGRDPRLLAQGQCAGVVAGAARPRVATQVGCAR